MRLEAGQREQSTTVIGFQDFVDDGDSQVSVGIGPCKSNDPRFNFATVHTAMASTWNEDFPFATIDAIEPHTSSMLGEMVVVQGSHLDRVSRVCVKGIDVSQGPDFRVSVVELNEAGVKIQDEIELTSPGALIWFERVTRNATDATGIPLRPNVTSNNCAKSGASSSRRETPSAVGASMSGSRPECPQCNLRMLRLHIKTSIQNWLASDTLSVQRTLSARFDVPNPEDIVAKVEDIVAKVKGNPQQSSITVTVTIPAGLSLVPPGCACRTRMSKTAHLHL
jgi:hypothetical protein